MNNGDSACWLCVIIDHLSVVRGLFLCNVFSFIIIINNNMYTYTYNLSPNRFYLNHIVYVMKARYVYIVYCVCSFQPVVALLL